MTMATAAIVGTAISAAATVGTGVMSIMQANQQAKAAEMNAQLAQQAADDAYERGEEKESQSRRDAAQLFGQQAARMAANGIDLSFGSAEKTLGDTKVLGDEDALRTRENARREAYGFQIDAANSRDAASAARSAGIYSAGKSLLAGASTVAGALGPNGSITKWRQSRSLTVPG